MTSINVDSVNENMNQRAINDIIKYATNIEQLIYFLDVKGKDYAKDYKLDTLMNIKSVLKKCVRCGQYFLPNPNTLNHQIYCGIACRNQATRDIRYKYKLDEYQKPVDLLRKQIYERKYRANRDGKYFNQEDYNIILRKLSILLSKRNVISKNEFFKQYSDLYTEYREAVKKQKANT